MLSGDMADVFGNLYLALSVQYFQNNQNQSGMISTNSTYIEFYRDNNSWNAIKNNSSNMYIYGAGVYKAS